MLLLQNNKLVQISITEDNSLIKAIKLKEDLDSQFAINDEIRKLVIQGDGKYNFKVIQSEFSDASSLEDFYHPFTTKGEAISRMLEDNYMISINGNFVTKESLIK